MTRRPSPPRHVAFVAFPDVEVLDVIGPMEVFSQAAIFGSTPGGGPAYTVELVARRAGPLMTSCGARLIAERAATDVRSPIDTLVVAGGLGTEAAMQDRLLVAWIRRTARRVRRVASVCSGAFLLAEAGLLEGRRATTHWRACDELALRYPGVRVESDPIFVRDGDVYTSAGVSAGMDLALALVEDDLGREVALEVARNLVLFLKRPGGQSQFSSQLAVQAAEREPLRRLQTWIADHLTEDLSVPALAREVAMSERNFSRLFARETGTTPARFVERARLEAARRRLEESPPHVGVEEIAAQAGFASSEILRRAFLRAFGVAPSAYRTRFRSAMRA
jgi:transcriptional regulator GlxA family with amidase domain